MVRDAQLEDAAAIVRVRTRGWQKAYAQVFPADELRGMPLDGSLDWWSQLLHEAPPRTTTLVAEVHGAVVGFASMGPARGESAGELYAIYVDPEHWGDGLGRALIQEAERRLTESGFAEAILWVLDDNPRARRFYEAAGWSADGAAKQDTFLGTAIEELRYRKTL